MKLSTILNVRKKYTKEKLLKIRYFLINYFQNIHNTKITISLAPWTQCHELTKKLRIDENHPQNVDFYYNIIQKILKYEETKNK